MWNTELRDATPEDESSIRALLESYSLPTQDLDIARPEFVVACQKGEVIGAGALQRFDDAALVRSVAVASNWRRTGAGRRIIWELERRARARGIRRLILLTQSARAFFEHQGYRLMDRASVPAAVLATAEFRHLCPSSAACLQKTFAGADSGGTRS